MVDGKFLRVESGKELAAKEHIEHKGSTPPSAGCGRKAGAGGKRRGGRRPDPGLTGEQMGKWTGFSRIKPALTRLFPHVSTQVVDFPHLNAVSIFSGGAKNDRISGRGMIGRGMGDEGQAELGTNVGKWEVEWWSIGAMGKPARMAVSGISSGRITDFFAFFRELPRFYAQNRAVFTRFLASQARHKLDAQVGCSLARNVVAFLRMEAILADENRKSGRKPGASYSMGT